MTGKESSDGFRINLSEEDLMGTGEDAWADALSEFEDWEKKAAAAKAKEAEPIPPAQEEKPKAAAPAPSKAPQQPIKTSGKMTRYEELCKTPSIKMSSDDLNVMTEFSNIIAKVNRAVSLLEKLKTEHSYAAEERFLTTWHGNAREVQLVMMKEFQQMQHGRVEKKYDQRCICKKCHSVFMEPIPGGVCDECKAASMPRAKQE